MKYSGLRRYLKAFPKRHSPTPHQASDAANFKKARFFFLENEPARVYFVIAEGRVKITQTSADGFQVILHDGFLSPDNQKFYLASQTDNWMAVIDAVNWTLEEKIPTGDTPPWLRSSWGGGWNHIWCHRPCW